MLQSSQKKLKRAYIWHIDVTKKTMTDFFTSLPYFVFESTFPCQISSLPLGYRMVCLGKYIKFLPRKQGNHMVTVVYNKTVHILQDGLEDTFSIR